MRLKLTKGYYTIVDDDDPQQPWRFKWYAQVDKKRDGTIRTVYAMRDAYPNGKRKTIMLHRFLLGVRSPKVFVDHRDGDGLNNRRKNIKRSDCGKNQRDQNRRTQHNNTSGITGVSWNKQQRKWVAYIKFKGKQRCLGSFVKQSDAIKARRQGVERWRR